MSHLVVFIVTLLVGMFLFFPHITLVNFGFRATGQFFTLEYHISVEITLYHDKLKAFLNVLKIYFFTVKGVI